MIKEFKKSLGYICPGCSAIAIWDKNLFDFSGESPTVFSCHSRCGEECVTITPKKDKYSIVINCPMCDEAHVFNIRKITFWQTKFFVLHCPETGIGILFLGDHDTVKKELEEQEEMFVKLSEECDVTRELTMIFEIVERINEIAKEEQVSCICGSHAISIEIDNEKITLKCRDCGKIKDIPSNEESLNNLLNASAIVLD